MIRACTLKVRNKYAPALAAAMRTLGLCRGLYNVALQERRDAYRKLGKSPSFFDQCKSLTVVRGTDPMFAALDATMTRLTVLRRLDLAYKAFFRRVKAGEKPGYPRFKSRDRFDTLVFGKSGWSLEGTRLTLKGIGTLRVTSLPHRSGKPIGLRLVHKDGCWWAHVLMNIGTAPAVKPAQNGIGIDVGIRTFATMSDGATVEHPRFLRESTEAIVAASQALARKKRGSNRRKDAKAHLAHAHAKIANRRREFIRQTAAFLARKYDGFAVEKLDIADMASTERDAPEGMNERQARGMRRGIMDSAWGMFAATLACKAEEAGMPFVAVNPKGTSQRCSGCGTPVRKTLRDREHNCAACGLVIDRDVNAARNIHDLGLKVGGAVDREGSVGGAS